MVDALVVIEGVSRSDNSNPRRVLGRRIFKICPSACPICLANRSSRSKRKTPIEYQSGNGKCPDAISQRRLVIVLSSGGKGLLMAGMT